MIIVPMKLAFVRLHLQEPAAPVLAFYERAFGMRIVAEFEASGEKIWWVGFGHDHPSANIEFRTIQQAASPKPYVHRRTDLYWKIGLSLQDVELGRRRLEQRGVHVGPADQFLNIGYLCHLRDPAGYGIELLQHDFKENFRPVKDVDESLPLGQRVSMGQITLRTRDPELALRFYGEVLGMKYLSRQDASPYDSVLYFLACTAEEPPSRDVDAVVNREWLWRRPWTQIELQHQPEAARSSGFFYTLPDGSKELGFAGVGFLVERALMGSLYRKVLSSGVKVLAPLGQDDTYRTHSFTVAGPDGVPVACLEQDG